MTPAHYTTHSPVSLHSMRWLSGLWVRLYRTTTPINYSLLLALVLDYHRMAGYVVLYNVTVLGIGFGVLYLDLMLFYSLCFILQYMYHVFALLFRGKTILVIKLAYYCLMLYLQHFWNSLYCTLLALWMQLDKHEYKYLSH